MLKTRLLSAAVFIPLAVGLMWLGGWLYALAVSVVLLIAGLEYVALLRKGGFAPFFLPLLAAILLAVAARYFELVEVGLGPGLAALLIINMAWMVAAFGRGDKQPATNFGLTLGGSLYLGWLGGHFLALRLLPDGAWWAILTIVTTGMGDVGAYFTGRAIGRHKLAPAISPAKTWEGYWGGALTAVGFGLALAALAAPYAPTVQPLDGLILGALVGLISPVGDLGMSVLKRMVGVKHFGNILPGHGGMLDRIDSILVGATLGYYGIVWFFLALA